MRVMMWALAGAGRMYAVRWVDAGPLISNQRCWVVQAVNFGCSLEFSFPPAGMHADGCLSAAQVVSSTALSCNRTRVKKSNLKKLRMQVCRNMRSGLNRMRIDRIQLQSIHTSRTGILTEILVLRYLSICYFGGNSAGTTNYTNILPM